MSLLSLPARDIKSIGVNISIFGTHIINFYLIHNKLMKSQLCEMNSFITNNFIHNIKYIKIKPRELTGKM